MKTELTLQQIRSLSPKNLRIMRKEKLTQYEIAKVCGVSETTIHDRLKEYKIKKYK